MILDYVPETGCYTVSAPRAGLDATALMAEHGLDFSLPASTVDTAVFFTRVPYAAVAFAEQATERARRQLADILDAVEKSRAASAEIPRCWPDAEELWPFQRASLAYALARKHSLCADSPGLGKTATAICFCNAVEAKSVLVLCPANIRQQWCRQIQRWSTATEPYLTYPILSGKRGVHPDAEWTVVSYDLARTEAIGKALARRDYDVLILDESHFLKTIDSRRTRAVFGGGTHREFDALAMRSTRILALSGTPLPNRPRECWTIARGLCYDSIDWMGWEAFKSRFNPSLMVEGTRRNGTAYRWVEEKCGRSYELQARLRANFMARHEKRDVMPQIAAPRIDIVLVEKSGPVRQALAAESLLDIDPSAFDTADMEIMGHVAQVRRLMGVAKAPLAAEYVKMLLEGGEEKIVVFAHHIEVLDILKAHLIDFGLVRVDGSTSPANRTRFVDAFVKNREVRVFLGNMQAVGIGTDGLQEVSAHAVFAECSWVPGENTQCIDRLVRIGQQNEVQADFLVAPGSMDERILGAALRKAHETHRALDEVMR